MAAAYRVRFAGSGNPNFSGALSKSQFCRHCRREILTYQKHRRYCSLQCYQEDPSVLRRACRKDNNHAEIVSAFRKLQCRVVDLSGHGAGVPDLLVGLHAMWHLVEIKNVKASYGRKGLSKSQRRFNEQAGGDVVVVSHLDDVLALVTKWRKEATADELGKSAVVHKWRTAQDALDAIGCEVR
jgi:hypothetical protein